MATIDTMLSFYLAFIYADRDYYDADRILCMADLLFTVQQKNRLEQKGLLERFSIVCYGKQETLSKIREEKSHMYETLKRGTKQWDYYFLKYDPSKKYKKKNTRKKKKSKSKKKNKTRKSLLKLIGI